MGPLTSPLEATSQAEIVEPAVNESRTSIEFGGNKGEDVPLDEDWLWVPEFTGLARAGFDRSLYFMEVKNNETVLSAALLLACDCTMPEDVELLKGNSLEGVWGHNDDHGYGACCCSPSCF